MAHLHESILSKEINYVLEYEKLKNIFLEKQFDFEYRETPFQFFEDYFTSLDISANYANMTDLISDIEKNPVEEAFLQFCEFLLTLYYQLVEKKRGLFDFITSSLSEIKRIIDYDFDKLSLKREIIEDRKLGKIFIIVPKDIVMEEAIESIDDNNVKEKLILYRCRSNEGNKEEKESILKCVMNYFEKLVKDPRIIQRAKSLVDDFGFFANNFEIRHNNKDEGVNDTMYYKETEKDREEWLDKIYSTLLSLLLVKKQIEISDDVKTLKQSVANKSN